MTSDRRVQPSPIASWAGALLFGGILAGVFVIAIVLDDESRRAVAADGPPTACPGAPGDGWEGVWTALVVEQSPEHLRVAEIVDWTPPPSVSSDEVEVRVAPGDDPGRLLDEVVDLVVECRGGELWLESATVIDPD